MCEVSIVYDKSIVDYNILAPFNPPQLYPELKKFKYDMNPKNLIYEMVRNLLKLQYSSNENVDNEKWNPFGKLINKGDQVLIKPNLVKHFHPYGDKGVISTITNAAILRPIIDYIILALDGTGRIIIADTPLEKTIFKEVIKLGKIDKLLDFYKNFLKLDIELYDLRSFQAIPDEYGKYSGDFIELSGPPGGYIKIDLGNTSELAELDKCGNPDYFTLADHSIKLFEVRSNKRGKTNIYHCKNHHIYKIPKIVLNSDVVFSIPKLKTHRMAGVTISLKNMIGICEKIYLPHHRRGLPPFGDAYPKLPDKKTIFFKKLIFNLSGAFQKKFYNNEKVNNTMFFKKILYPLYNFSKSIKPFNSDYNWWGSWSGNDTLWRTIYDLNKILFYSDKNGKMKNKQQRKYFSIVDGIIGQEGKGPMSGDPKPCGILLGSSDPVAVDTIASFIIGYDIDKLKIIKNGNKVKKYKLGCNDLSKIKINSNIADPLEINLNFKLPEGYKDIKRDLEINLN